jgi:Fe-S cluster assembly protein SufB
MEMAIEQTLISISEDTILQFEGSGNATVYICVSGGVDVTIRENVLGGYINLRIVLIVSSGSTARYVVNRSVSHTGHNVILRQSEIADRAHLSWVGVEFHSLNSVSHYISHLVGYGASTDHSIAFMNSGVDVSDIYTKNRHSAENTYSNIYVKGVLEDSATCFYRGLIEMEEGMSGSVGHEKARILMLDSNTKCNTVPSLSVRHDDVKCSHSVSVSRLDEDQMFYLKSRGMDENSAREIMKEAHLTDILMKL